MKKAVILVLVTAFATGSFATVINIPADYPSIQQGINVSNDGDTVLVQPGTYVENPSFNGHNIVLGSLFLITGNIGYIEQTIIDGDSSGHVVCITDNENSNTQLTGFTITNGFGPGGGIGIANSEPRILHNIISNNTGTVGGGGIDCLEANPIIIGNVIKENFSEFKGAGIYCYNSTAIISNNIICKNLVTNQLGRGGGIYCGISQTFINNNLIYDNTSSGMGGGISCASGDPVIVNNLLFGNVAGGGSGGGVYCWSTDPDITNCILWDDTPTELTLENSTGAEISYCDIEGGWPGIGNIDVNPLFRDAADGDFHLMSTDCGDPYDSPCIDAGDPYLADSLLDCSWGLGGIRSDMGAYGGGDSLITTVMDDAPRIPRDFVILKSYPNPFNGSTTIEFNVSELTYILITIYDLLGREVEILFEGVKEPGVYAIDWNAEHLPSGIYFARFASDNVNRNIKMLMLR